LLVLGREHVGRPPGRDGKIGERRELAGEAFVDATSISGPAKVGITTSLPRAIVEPGTLSTDSTWWRCSRAQRNEASVSAVSPDYDTNTKIVSPKRWRAIAEFGRDIDIHRHLCEALEPLFGNEGGVIR
jgi:hypothetical protein